MPQRKTTKMQARKQVLNGVWRLQKLRYYLAQCQQKALEFDSPEGKGRRYGLANNRLRELIDPLPIEKEIAEVLMELYDGLKTYYPDFQLARGVDGDFPIWAETEGS